MTERDDWRADLEGRVLSPAEYSGLARRILKAGEGLHPVRLVFLSSWTTTLLTPALVVEGARRGLHLDVHHGEFGQFESAILGDDWRGAEGQTEALVVALRLEDVDPDFTARFYREGAEAHDRRIEDVLTRLDETVRLFRERSDGPVLVAGFSPPTPAPLGPFDANVASSLTHRVAEMNTRLAERLEARAGVHVWDYPGLVASTGSSEWTDPRLWALTRTAVAAAHHPRLAAHLTRTLRATLVAPAKCLVLDLDNTLWGGAVGDDGVAGIVLGDEYPGRAFKEFQRAVLGLRDRGVLLAVASKNDRDVVEEAIAMHPEMLVAMDDFSAARIDWQPKSVNLRSIAEELNIGLDALVLFDDNPVERAEVALGAPGVGIVAVPADPAGYVQALSDFEGFDAPRLTEEDRGRATSYRAQGERERAGAGAASIEDFLASLSMTARIGRLDALSANRAAQLVGKTNQFNLTTRRQSQAELESDNEEGVGVWWLRLADRYGDLGLIAVAVLRAEGSRAVIHNFVLSCRAANRGVEQTLLAHIADHACAAGFETLVGEYRPSDRNHVVAQLYPSLGFVAVEAAADVARYELPLASRQITTPEHMYVETA